MPDRTVSPQAVAPSAVNTVIVAEMLGFIIATD